MGRLLSCVDDSDRATQIARYSAELAERLGLDLVLVHVTPSTHAPGVSAAPAGLQRLHEAERSEAEEILARVAGAAGIAPEVERRAELGAPAERIVALCSEVGAELVVLGSRGRGIVKTALLGSISTEVAATAPCPCVIVSGHAAERLAAT